MVADPGAQWLAAAANHFQQGRLHEAEALYRRALESQAMDARALLPLGFILCQLGRMADGLAMFEATLAANPRLHTAHTAAGYVLLELGRGGEALAHFAATLGLRPGDSDALKGQGMVLAQARRHSEAIASYQAALATAPADPEIHYNLGNSLLASGRAPEAVKAYDDALRNRRQFAEALNNRGAALRALDRADEALASFLEALRARPNFADALHNVGNLLFSGGRCAEAIDAYERALAVNPDYPYTAGAVLLAKMTACDWQSGPQLMEQVLRGPDAGHRVAVPLVVSLAASAPELTLRCAQIWVADRFPAAREPLWRGEHYDHKRIRVAYLSADFHEHPVAYSLAGVIERHDRTRFEALALSFRSGRTRSATRVRLERGFDRFIDVSAHGDLEVAGLLRDLEVDIAIDLMGHTDGSRTGVFALRAAPIQVNYLGYPGTLGADYIDYILADPVALPPDERRHYVEHAVYMPHSYLPSDHRQLVAASVPTRETAGLPAEGFVFCAFNNTSKITPGIFEIWMRLLQRVERGVLWLSARNPLAAENLRAHAERHQVSRDRLIFAPRLQTLEEHLARQRLADLFLDTVPYSAHTTAADALWAGVPIVTCMGTTMAGRASASLLTAAGLPDLVTHSLAEYEDKALALATNPTRLGELHQHLVAIRGTSAVFDTERYCRNLERAYLGMWNRHLRGETPCSFAVEGASTGC